MKVIAVFFAFCLVLHCEAQSTETFTVNSSVHQLSQAIYGTFPDTITYSISANPLLQTNSQGNLTKAQLDNLINQINQAIPPPTSNRATIVHLLRWANSEHTQVAFQKWYLQDPSSGRSSLYFDSKESRLQRTTISGQTKFRLIYGT